MHLLFDFGCVFQIYCKEVLIKVLIFDFSVNYSFVVWHSLSSDRSSVIKNEKTVNFKVSSYSLIRYHKLILVFTVKYSIFGQNRIYFFLSTAAILVNRVSF